MDSCAGGIDHDFQQSLHVITCTQGYSGSDDQTTISPKESRIQGDGHFVEWVAIAEAQLILGLGFRADEGRGAGALRLTG